MPISALTEYYEFLKQNNKIDTPDGFSKERIHYLVCLTPDGQLTDIISHKITTTDVKGKPKESPTEELFPKRSKTSSTVSHIIDHRFKYIFGLQYNTQSGRLECVTNKNKSKNPFDEFKKTQFEFLTDIQSDLARAVLLFSSKWNPLEQFENPLLQNNAKEFSASSFAFCLDGNPSKLLGDDNEVQKKWLSIYNSQTETDEVVAQCAISGSLAPIARLHNSLKGVYGGQPSGTNFVSFKEPAYESYGKKQSYNSNISKDTMLKYTTAFNILAASRKHSKIIDDMTIIYWVLDRHAEQILQTVDFCIFGGEGDDIESEELSYQLDNIFKNAVSGNAILLDGNQVSPQTFFYTLGIVPNASRIAIRFFTKQTLGNLLKNIMLHQTDFAIGTRAKQIYFRQILNELKSPKSTKERVPPPLMAELIKAATEGGLYPSHLLAQTVNRIKIDSDEENNRFIKLNQVRASIIKACINRKSRLNKKKEDLTMGLNLENKNPAYLCGRLFAVLEKIQKDYAPSLNKTVKDSYFASACSNPSAIFSRLMTLANYHLSKLKESSKVYYEKLIGNIAGEIKDEFPQRLSLDDQGRFILGYYQQNQNLYTKKNAEEEFKNGSN